MSAVRQLKREHQLQPVVFRMLCDGFAGHLRGLVVLVGVAVSVHFGVVGVFLVVAAQLGHFLVGGNGVVKLRLFAVENGQPVEEEGTVVLLLIGVLAVRVFGAVGEFLENGNRVAVVAERVVEQALVKADFQRVRHEILGFFQRGERFVIVALAAFNFGK